MSGLTTVKQLFLCSACFVDTPWATMAPVKNTLNNGTMCLQGKLLWSKPSCQSLRYLLLNYATNLSKPTILLYINGVLLFCCIIIWMSFIKIVLPLQINMLFYSSAVPWRTWTCGHIGSPMRSWQQSRAASWEDMVTYSTGTKHNLKLENTVPWLVHRVIGNSQLLAIIWHF